MMQEKIDAVILAGTHRSSKRLIRDKNKAFLELEGKSLITHVTEQVLQTPQIHKIIVVGPREELEIMLKPLIDSDHRLRIVQQRSRMLENVWNGFLATFPDGNNLPFNREINTLLLGGHLPIRNEAQLYVFYAVYAAIAAQMAKDHSTALSERAVLSVMEHRFDEFRQRYERREFFMGRISVNTLLTSGHILHDTDQGICFQRPELFEFFWDWECRFNKKIIVTACDLPLLTHQALSDFVDRASAREEDFIFGVATSELLEHFYTGDNGRPGIIRPYLWLREAKIRAANLILVKPNRIGNKELIQESFGIRKMTEWGNVLSMIWKLVLQKNRYQTTRTALMLQTVAMLHRNNYKKAAEWLRQYIRTARLEDIFSRLFMTQFKLITVQYGGVSLDIDTEEDYIRLSENYRYWLQLQEKLASEFGRQEL